MTQETFESDFQMAYANTSDQHDVYHYYNGNNYGHFMSDGSIGTDESNLWSSSPRSDTPSPNSYIQNTVCGSYQTYKPMNSYSPVEHHVITYRNGYSHFAMSDIPANVPFVRVVKRRTTANKKERRRTQSINNAYADLRDCIPNVPADTKLSKIKTLRLATSYISYLTKALESDDPTMGFKAELANLTKKSSNHPVQSIEELPSPSVNETTEDNQRKAKGRTGWPQHVWALELKQEQTI